MYLITSLVTDAERMYLFQAYETAKIEPKKSRGYEKITEIDGKNILITGGACGIGRLMGLKMAALGGNIIIWDINQDNMEKVANEIKEANGTVYTYLCDVSDRDAIYATAEEVKKDVGKVDILINNAGIVSGKLLLQCTDEQIERLIKVNLMAHFWTTRSFLPEMLKTNSGHIVTIASAAGIIGNAQQVDYCASKFANFGFDEALRMELKKNELDIQTTVVCPYYINTGMFEGVTTRYSLLLPILEEDDVVEKIVKAIRKNKRRLIIPSNVALIWLFRLLPVKLFDMCIDLMGVNESMETFRGRR